MGNALARKKGVPSPHGAGNQQQAANLAFLSLLTTQLETAFQQLIEFVPTTLEDRDLLTLEEAYDVRNGHSVTDYKARFHDTLQRFEASGIGRMGVQWSAQPFGPQKVETKAFWVTLPAGRRLAVYERPHAIDSQAGEQETSPFGNPLHTVTSAEAADRQRNQDATHPFEFRRFVPDDLVETAVTMHRQQWGEEPTDRSDEGAWIHLAGGKS